MSINPALRTNNPMNNIKQMMKMVQMAQNPQAALQSLMTQNPQLMQVMQMTKSMNTDLKTAYYRLAAQKGIDAGLINPNVQIFLIILIILTSFVVPLILKAAYKNDFNLEKQILNASSKEIEEANNIQVEENIKTEN